MNLQESGAEIFDVLLCHNSGNKPAVREIAQKLHRLVLPRWRVRDVNSDFGAGQRFLESCTSEDNFRQWTIDLLNKHSGN